MRINRRFYSCLHLMFSLVLLVQAGNAQENESTTQLPSTTAPPNSVKKTNDKTRFGKSKPPAECPVQCTCLEKKISCEGKKLAAIPNLSDFVNVTEINLKENNIKQLDFSLLPLQGALEVLDISKNNLTTLGSAPTSSKKELNKLKTLNLSENPNFKNVTNWNLSVLENLDLSQTGFTEISSNVFNKTLNLKELKLFQTPITSLHDQAFASLSQLKKLNLSGVQLNGLLSNKLFSKNQKLEVIDLSDCKLIEVPEALRSTSSLTSLMLNRNLMTSLRESDFVNRANLTYLEIRECPKLKGADESAFRELYNLKKLILSDNPKLYYISMEAFKTEKRVELEVLDLRGNNISTLPDLREFTSLEFKQVMLSNNPWNCNCDLKWLQTLPLTKRSPVHCKSPEQFKDIEISQFFLTTDCELQANNSAHIILLTGFLLFLLGLTVAVFVQKSEFCRRLMWKDQYGTIYYTKASFPPENA